jgi:hypothetical protein
VAVVGECPVQGPPLVIDALLSSEEFFEVSDRRPAPFVHQDGGAHVTQAGQPAQLVVDEVLQVVYIPGIDSEKSISFILGKPAEGGLYHAVPGGQSL